jgi:hypothetical protein
MDSISGEMRADYEKSKVKIGVFFGNGTEKELDDFTVTEIMLGESLLTPGLQTSIKAHSYKHSPQNKNFDNFRGAAVRIELEKEILRDFGFQSEMTIDQVVYRLHDRQPINNQTESLTLRACDQSLLNDAETLVSKSWKCTTPSKIVEYVLQSCAGVKNLDIEPSDPARDYIAENIHPFQVVNQQSNYALAEGDDPSFLHYMTYQNLGTHHFKSLKSLTKQSPVASYVFNDTNAAYPYPTSIMSYSFPCDFDLLSDVLNGISTSGRPLSSVALFDPLLKTFSLMGNQNMDMGCGNGEGVFRYAITNQRSAANMNACPDYAKEYLRKRQARMGLIEKDKIALRMTVPFNISLNVGKVVDVSIYNKELLPSEEKLYGSGKYLILHMYHHIMNGGFGTTTLDCVSTTVGQGEV